MRNRKLIWMVKVAILSAMAFIIMFLEFPIPPFPQYLKMDLSDLPAILGAFALGPFAGIVIELIKNLLHLFRSDTGGIGEAANFFSGASFVLFAGLIYVRRKSRLSAVIGLLVGAIAASLVMCAANYYVFLPLYTNTPPSPTVLPLIFTTIFPFNFLKGLILSASTLLLYKKLSPILHK